MDEETLRAFASACRTGNITRSAKQLHRSQSALSRRIASLEQEVGAQLLERVPGGVRPTAPGAAFLRHADAALAALSDGQRAVRQLVTSDVGPVSVVLVGTLATGWVAAALRAFRQAHPRVALNLQTANSNEVIDLVRRADADIGIGYAFSEDIGLASEPLFDEALRVACGPDHSRAGRNVRSLRTLRDETWFAFAERLPRAETNARFIAGLLSTAGIPAVNVHTVDSLTAQLRLVEAGFGLALLAESNLAAPLASGQLATIETGERPSTSVYLTSRTDGIVTHATQSLLTQLRDSAPR